MRRLTLSTISVLAVSMGAALLAVAALADVTTKDVRAVAKSVTAKSVTAKSVTAKSVTAKSVADKRDEYAKTELTVSARDTSSLRCWQEGQLLFEQTHLAEKKLSSSQSMMVFKSDAGGESREVYLINSGTATCLYEKI